MPEKIKIYIKQKWKENSKAMLLVKGILTLLLIFYMLSVYPGYLIHDYYISKPSMKHVYATEPIADGALTVQYFRPQSAWMGSILFAAGFNEEKSGEAAVAFTLYEESGREILSREIMLADMKPSEFYEVAVDKKLNVNELYYWSVTTPADTACEWSILYTEGTGSNTPENTLFLIGENVYGSGDAQSFSQYKYYSHHDKAVIAAGWWTGGILVYIVLLECVNRIFERHSGRK